jgi:UDP-3-O-[3-hydroxymyristoyl] glucosamine N-acyltransferase
MQFSLTDLLAVLSKSGQLSIQITHSDNVLFSGFSSLRNPRPGTLSWARETGDFKDVPSQALLVPESTPIEVGLAGPLLIPTSNPRLAFLTAMQTFVPASSKSGIHPSAVVADSARLGKDVSVGPLAFVGEDVQLDEGVVIGPGVIICCPCRIGARSVIHGGSVIGADGFGFERDADGALIKFPHIGGVTIGRDVEIGANSCIDRGTLDDTSIGDGVKIDNLCHVAHNVTIDSDAVVTACSMFAGGVHVGKQTWIAPCAVVREGIKIGDGATIGLGSVVTKDVEANEFVVGVPARGIKVRNVSP